MYVEVRQVFPRAEVSGEHQADYILESCHFYNEIDNFQEKFKVDMLCHIYSSQLVNKLDQVRTVVRVDDVKDDRVHLHSRLWSFPNMRQYNVDKEKLELG